MNSQALLDTFYTSFSEGNAKGMNSCYHKDIIFQDPAFGILKGKRARAMWEMLLSKKENDLKVEYKVIEIDDLHGKVNWTATYNFGPKKRHVVNKVSAFFEFKDGKIYRHTDYFNTYKWSKQAMGLSGFLLGWTPFFQNKIKKKTNILLSKYIND